MSAYQGYWRVIHLRPDLASAQTLAVGIVTYWNGRLYASKLLEDLSRVEALYKAPPRLDNIRYTLERARATLNDAQLKGRPCPDVGDLSPHLEWSDETIARYPSPEDLVRDLYATQIALEPDGTKPGKPRFQFRDAQNVRHALEPLLKDRLQMRFNEIWRQDRLLRVKDDAGREHWLGIDVHTADTVGTIASAVYKDPSTVQLNLLLGDRDLRTVMQRDHASRGGLFVLRPGAEAGLSESEQIEIDEVIDELAWKIRAPNFVFEVEDNESALADRIAEFVPA